jgi:TRAP-type uncharacterized transport system substrate-binding protein
LKRSSKRTYKNNSKNIKTIQVKKLENTQEQLNEDINKLQKETKKIMKKEK